MWKRTFGLRADEGVVLDDAAAAAPCSLLSTSHRTKRRCFSFVYSSARPRTRAGEETVPRFRPIQSYSAMDWGRHGGPQATLCCCCAVLLCCAAVLMLSCAAAVL
jgi:hypothetical protein